MTQAPADTPRPPLVTILDLSARTVVIISLQLALGFGLLLAAYFLLLWVLGGEASLSLRGQRDPAANLVLIASPILGFLMFNLASAFTIRGLYFLYRRGSRREQA